MKNVDCSWEKEFARIKRSLTDWIGYFSVEFALAEMFQLCHL